MAMDIMNHSKKNGVGMLVDKYEHFAHEVQEALFENKKALAKLKKATEEALSESGDKVKDVALHAQRTVKKNPWAYIGAAFGTALLIGFALGKKK